MRPWRIRLAIRRSRVQWALLGIVLLVSVLSATMLASLFLLSSATERFSAREALTQSSDADIRVTHSIAVEGDPESIVAASIETAKEFFGDVPFESEVRFLGGILAIPRANRSLALGHLGFQDGIEDNAVLGEGRWPQDVPGSTIEATVPMSLLDDLDLDVGDTLKVYPYGEYDEAFELDIVGTYQARAPETDFWRFDPYDGLGYVPNALIPNTGGRLTTDGFGPLVVARNELAGLDVASISIDHVPDYSEASQKDLEGIIEREEGASQALTIALGAKADTVEVFTRSETTLGKVVGSLAVTRSNVLVTGLLLLVLSIAALGQTSRLMAERRNSEQHLMTARGASSRQLFRLGIIEAIVLAAITTAISPFLSRLAYRVLANVDLMKNAGMDRDPGLPPLIWIVAGVVGLVLVMILVAPLLRRSVTFVEGEQARSRQNRATTLQRSGLDIALLVLAILAYVQLRGYRSPVTTTGDVAGVDPLLASGPALALLAGALVCVRLIPAASRFLEGVASRGRRAVTPLAAWEVGRRSTRAVSAILLLTLAISVGSFSLSFLSTWRDSQVDQAGFIHPADVEIGGLESNTLTQYDIVNDASLGAVAAPVFERDGEISASLREGNLNRDFSGRPVHLIAMPNAGLVSFTDGRVGTEGGTTIAESLTLPEDTESRGILLPGSPDGLEFTLTLSSSETAIKGLSVALRILIRDDDGTFVTLDAGTFPIDGEERTVRALLGEEAGLSSPSSIVGLQTLWFTAPGAENIGRDVAAGGAVDLELSIDGMSVLVAGPAVPVVGLPPQYSIQPIEIQDDIVWHGMAVGVDGTSLNPEDDQIRIEMEVPVSTLLKRTVSISQMAFPIASDLPVVANQAVLTRLGLDVGDRASVEIDGVVFNVRFVGAIPNMPGGAPRNPTIVANSDEFQVMLMQAGAPSPVVTSWWTEVPPENADRYLSTLPAEAIVTTRLDVVHTLQDDPLRVGIQAALWLVIGAAIALAALGFGVHAVVTVRARELEFAQLRAVGLSRGALTRLISAESALLAILGTLFGLGLGIALGYLVAPLISVGPDGRPPIPSVIVDIPWGTVGLLAAEVAAVLALVVFLVSLLVRRIDPAALLRVEG